MKLALNESTNNDLKKTIVRACFDCHVYCIINVNNYKAIQLLQQFEKTHRGHYFINGIPAIIYEFKFSKSQKPFRSYHVQAQIYGFLLREMKFKTTSLFYAIIIIPPEMRNNIRLMKELPKRILQSFFLEALHKKEKSMLTIDNVKIFINKFNPAQAERDLNWALEFWKGERIAIPTSKIYKCQRCEYKTKCGEK